MVCFEGAYTLGTQQDKLDPLLGYSILVRIDF